MPSATATSRSHWWTNPTIVVPSVIAIAGLLVSAYFALSPRSAPLTDPLSECQRHYPHARGTAVSDTPIAPKGAGSSSRFEGCVSTPIPGTDSAGHWVVRVRDFVIPGSFAAQEFTNVEVFDTSCVALALDYQFNSQETTSHSRFTVETTQTVSGYNGKPVNLTAAGPSLPPVVVAAQGSHLLVLVNNRYQLQRMACLDLPNPPST